MSDTYLAIQTLRVATGTALFGLLIVLAHRANRLPGLRDFGPHSAWLGLLWNAGMLVEFVGRLSGVSLTSRPMPPVSAAAYTVLALLPTIFLIEAMNRYEKQRPLAGKHWLLFFSSLISAVLTVNLFLGGLGVTAPSFRQQLLKIIA